LFGLLEPGGPAAVPRTLDVPEWSASERLAAEKDLLGFYVTGHPLDPYSSLLECYGMTDTQRLMELPNETMTRLGGIFSAVQQGFSRKTGKPYAMLTLEDLKGSVQLLCVNEAYEDHRELFTTGRAVFVVGEVRSDKDRPRLFPRELMPLEEVPRRFTRQVHIRLRLEQTDRDKLEEVRQLTTAHAGSCPLFLCFVRQDGGVAFVETSERFHVTPSLEFAREVERLVGRGAYYAKPDPTLPERRRRRWPSGQNGE
jgi:DNA polymerase-3 subunit alpha